MPADARLRLLRQRWEAARQRGQSLSAEELCHDCPELCDLLRQQLDLWQLDTGPGGVSWGLPLDDTSKPGAALAAAAPHGSPLHLAAGAEPVQGYRLVRPLGRGGFGEVWEAAGPGGFPVAMKFVHLAEQIAAAEQRALELMKRLRHPNLLALHGAWQHGDYLILAMELADGTLHGRLRQVVAQGRPGIPPEELLQYLREAAAGLDYLNGQGVQHRDVKPHNLLLVGGAVKVGDFGLAKLLQHTVASASGSMTAAYASPEACQDKLSRWSDQYSLAVTYCQLRGNALPFEGPLAAVVAGHLMGTPHLGMVPEGERPALARALAKDPQARWSSCAAFVTALAGGQAPPADVARTASLVPRAPRTAPRRSPWPVAVVCGLALLTPVLLAVVLWNLTASDGVTPAPAGKPRAGADAPKAKRDDGQKLPTEKEPEGAGSPRVKDPDPKPGPDDRKPQDKGKPAVTKPEPVRPAPALAREIKNSLGMELVAIPKGTFLMGSPANEEDREPFSTGRQEHEVEITRSFYLGRYEVTRGEFAAFVQARAYRTEGERAGDTDTWRTASQTDRHPVVYVSWNDAVAFCEWLSEKEGKQYRLPTEAEWEHSCRAGTTTRFHSGDDEGSLKRVAHYRGSGARSTAPVGTLQKNGFGLYDMHGNVWEWCEDWYSPNYYRNSPREDPRGPGTGTFRVFRGGSWNDESRLCRSAHRSRFGPSARGIDIGFRVACVR